MQSRGVKCSARVILLEKYIPVASTTVSIRFNHFSEMTFRFDIAENRATSRGASLAANVRRTIYERSESTM